MVQNGDMLNVDDILDSLAIKLIGVVPDDRSITISTNKGEPIVLNDKAEAGKAYRNIARRITGEEVAFMEMNSGETGLISSIKKLLGIR